MRTWAAAFAGFLILLLSLLALRGLARSDLAGISTTPRAVTTLSTIGSLIDEIQAIAVPTWKAPDVLVAPGWSGLITAVVVQAGDIVRTGQTVLVVDGVTRVAAATPFPFWRDLRPGDAGPDVKMLQSLMTDLGFYGGAATGQVDRATSDAVSKWGNSLGDTTGTSLFDRSWVIWLPVDVFKIERLDVQTGASAPPPGAAIAVAAAQLLSVSLLTQSDEPVGITDPAAWQVQLGSRVAGLAASQPVRVLEADLQRVADQFDADAKTTPAVITTKTPRSVVVVPASSVGSNADGGTCVWVPGDDGYMPVPVRVAGGSFNTAQLASGLPAASTVLVNPGEVLANPTCPSS